MKESDYELVCTIPEESIPEINRELVNSYIDVYAIVPVRNLEEYFISLV